eukprot:g16262.t1
MQREALKDRASDCSQPPLPLLLNDLSVGLGKPIFQTLFRPTQIPLRFFKKHRPTDPIESIFIDYSVHLLIRGERWPVSWENIVSHEHFAVNIRTFQDKRTRALLKELRSHLEVAAAPACMHKYTS